MKYLLDTDHISVLQLQAGPAYVTLRTRIALHPQSDLALSIVSLHEQWLDGGPGIEERLRKAFMDSYAVLPLCEQGGRIRG